MKKMFKWTMKQIKPGYNKYTVSQQRAVIFVGEYEDANRMVAAHNAAIDMFEHQLTALDVR